MFLCILCVFLNYWVSNSFRRHRMFDTNDGNLWQHHFLFVSKEPVWAFSDVQLQCWRVFRPLTSTAVEPVSEQRPTCSCLCSRQKPVTIQTSTRRPLISNVIICYFQSLETMTGPPRARCVTANAFRLKQLGESTHKSDGHLKGWVWLIHVRTAQ